MSEQSATKDACLCSFFLPVVLLLSPIFPPSSLGEKEPSVLIICFISFCFLNCIAQAGRVLKHARLPVSHRKRFRSK